MKNLLRCPHCGSFYRVSKDLCTDMGDKLYDTNGITKCLHCGKYSKYNLMESEDWILDLFFTIKG